MTDLKTPVFDWETGEFVIATKGRIMTATGGAAAVQIIAKAEQTPRGLYLIYADLDDPELSHKYGSDVHDILTRRELTEETRISELKRAIREAIIYDPWVTDVYDIAITQEAEVNGGASYVATYTVATIYDTITMEGVKLE